jgi:hypothetical protein
LVLRVDLLSRSPETSTNNADAYNADAYNADAYDADAYDAKAYDVYKQKVTVY